MTDGADSTPARAGTPDHDPTRLFVAHRTNAILAWLGCLSLVGIAFLELWRGDLAWAALVAFVAVLAIIPGPFYRTWLTTAPWELIAAVTAMVAWRSLASSSELALFAVIAGAAVLIAANLHLFTAARMSHRFIVVLVAISTAAVAGGWALVSWAADLSLGTSYITTNAELMWDLTAASLTGIVAGLAFDLYVRWWEARVDSLTPTVATGEGE